jgi:low affinity Fe/Cu permease
MKKKNRFSSFFEKFSNTITKVTGSSYAFLLALVVIIIWAVTGPIFGFSDTWQLVINTSTTIITFLMVFIIQHSQNKDTMAIQLKLNELIASDKNSSNRLIDIEDLTEDELVMIKKFYIHLATLAKKDANIKSSHSLDEANEIHEEKKSVQKITTNKTTGG